MPPLFPVDIRDADHPGQSFLQLAGHTEFGDLKFPAPECLVMVQVCLAPGRNVGVVLAGLFIAFGVSKISPMGCGPWRHRSLQDAPTAPAR